ncbi:MULTISPECIES: hypothetical protein [Dickeya]|uniref:hypothetical protein n=1 Tax=Dickeya TaxID=204037 RepID=UPI0031642625
MAETFTSAVGASPSEQALADSQSFCLDCAHQQREVVVSVMDDGMARYRASLSR